MLSWRTDLPEDNEIIDGHWFQRDESVSQNKVIEKSSNVVGGISVEIEVAKRLNINVGDF